MTPARLLIVVVLVLPILLLDTRPLLGHRVKTMSICSTIPQDLFFFFFFSFRFAISGFLFFLDTIRNTQLKMAGKFGKKGHDRWLGKRITRSHPSRLPPGLLFSDFSVFSNAFLFSYYSPILQTVCGSGATRALWALVRGKPRRREQFSLKHL